jgi:hypothetical protein
VRAAPSGGHGTGSILSHAAVLPWKEVRTVDGVPQLDGETTRPDLADQVAVVTLEEVLADAVQLGGPLTRIFLRRSSGDRSV